MESMRLEGEVAIVTGGASGIGASTVQLFRHHGATVIIADIQDNSGQALADSLGDAVTFIHCDVTDEDQVRCLFDAAIAKFGHVDIVFSNAGLLGREYPMSDIALESRSGLERILAVNLVGGFLVAKHAARVMRPRKKGCIVFTASACTKTAQIASYSYTVSKYGILGLSKGLAAELGFDGIRVNCVSPFGVLNDSKEKEMFENMMGRIGNLKGKILGVEDVAKSVLYLVSDESGYVSGVNLVLDGGYSVGNPSLFRAVKGAKM